MKFGPRTPSLSKRISARTSVKRAVRSKARVPKGYGFATNPRKAAYNRVYNRTSMSVDKSSGKGKSYATPTTDAQQRRLVERFEKKIQLAEEKRSRPLQKLKAQYADGKVQKSSFKKLQKRDADIGLDLVIFGRGAGVKLGERYLLGKITKAQFEKLKDEILGEPEAEKDEIQKVADERLKKVKKFAKKARSNKTDQNCNYCGKPKKWYSPLRDEADFRLCGKCKREYSKLKEYPGYTGTYYIASKSELDPDQSNRLTLGIVPDYVLNFR